MKENDIEDSQEEEISGTDKEVCFKLNRKLQAAIEMYNMDNFDTDEMIISMSKSEAPKVIRNLVKKGYLKKAPICPTTGKTSYYIDDDEIVQCEEHGHPY